MKIEMCLVGFFVFLTLGTAAMAGDITGKWIVPTEGVDIEMVLKVDGNSLTGTMNNPLSGETKIRDGKIDGDTLSFYVVPNFGRAAWKGRVTGDVIRMTRAIGGAPLLEVIAVRAKAIQSAQPIQR